MNEKLLAHSNFIITSEGAVSRAFLSKGIADFSQAAAYVKQLPYKRNQNKHLLETVLTDGFGTCSTKHALLKQLSAEHNANGVQLMLCIFKMNAVNTPKTAAVLHKHGLAYMLEAHNYLLVNGEILDCTTARSSAADFVNDMVMHMEIDPAQITDYKVRVHKEAIKNWLDENPEIKYTLEDMFAIREACIEALSAV